MKTTEKSRTKAKSLTSINVLDAICDRRAVRHYTTQVVDPDAVRLLLGYASQAPSAKNSQPWSFVVIQSSKLLKEISDGAKKILSMDVRWKSPDQHENRFLDPDFNIFYDSATLIVICATQEGVVPQADCYLAGQNLMLAAHGLGLGTCPIGLAWDILRTDKVREKLGIRSGHNPVLPIIVGYPLEPSERTSRKPAHILNWIS